MKEGRHDAVELEEHQHEPPEMQEWGLEEIQNQLGWKKEKKMGLKREKHQRLCWLVQVGSEELPDGEKSSKRIVARLVFPSLYRNVLHPALERR
jgi:hypothetical protein